MTMTHDVIDGRSRLVSKPSSPHPILIGVQIDMMQEVMRRMKAAQSTMLDPVTSEKLDRLKKS